MRDYLLSHFRRVQLCNPMDCSPPGSSVHWVLQARILEWDPPPGALPNPGIKLRVLLLLPWQTSSLPLAPPGKPALYTYIQQYVNKPVIASTAHSEHEMVSPGAPTVSWIPGRRTAYSSPSSILDWKPPEGRVSLEEGPPHPGPHINSSENSVLQE